ncbi:e3 ubiquitin-protein ligase [Cryptosporidium ryanae]|uniref:e3 ubiquitin-protein ligase n=1 Tax=Cryptosporidium ryanae TaxID=515981 RepID=UPI003519ED7A|nr:e3 ubiquitin-protein ligase [Cryptosporidium ryanae]
MIYESNKNRSYKSSGFDLLSEKRLPYSSFNNVFGTENAISGALFNPSFSITIRKSSIMKDTLEQLGVDEGVQKEFFKLLILEIFNLILECSIISTTLDYFGSIHVHLNQVLDIVSLLISLLKTKTDDKMNKPFILFSVTVIQLGSIKEVPIVPGVYNPSMLVFTKDMKNT